MRVTPAGQSLRDLSFAFASRQAGRAFLGYMTQQRERMTGERGGKHTNRPELIEKYGYDTKYAYLMLRLGMQGVEFLTTGRITLPVPEPDRGFLMDVRTGGQDLATVVAMGQDFERRIKGLLDTSPLPAEPNVDVVESWLLAAYADAWGW